MHLFQHINIWTHGNCSKISRIQFNNLIHFLHRRFLMIACKPLKIDPLWATRLLINGIWWSHRCTLLKFFFCNNCDQQQNSREKSERNLHRSEESKLYRKRTHSMPSHSHDALQIINRVSLPTLSLFFAYIMRFWNYPVGSHGNSYVFCVVANSYNLTHVFFDKLRVSIFTWILANDLPVTAV